MAGGSSGGFIAVPVQTGKYGTGDHRVQAHPRSVEKAVDWFTRDRENPRVFVSCWHQTWPLEITGNEGWHGAQEDDQVASRLSRFSSVFDAPVTKLGTDGALCRK